MIKTCIGFIFLIGFIVGFTWLQICLSRKENKWLGLILPIVCLCCSIITVLSFTAFNTVKHTSSVTQLEDGGIIEEDSRQDEESKEGVGEYFIAALPIFLVTNIPTGVNLLIYACVRDGKKKHSQMNKMNIQDLS